MLFLLYSRIIQANSNSKNAAGGNVSQKQGGGSVPHGSLGPSVKITSHTASTTTPHIDAAIAAIDSVHSTPHHMTAEIHNVRKADINGSRGRYDRSNQLSQVAEDGRWPGLTTAHELGHRLDHLGFGQGLKYGSELNTPEMADWWRAIRSTDAYKALENARKTGKVAGFDKFGNPVMTDITTERLTYYLKPQEVFARSYAEYIALKAAQKAHPELAAQLGIALKKDEALRFRTQGTHSDFAPVMKAFDKLFSQKGLLR